MAADRGPRCRDRPATEARPAAVLTEFDHLLPAGGDALDVACGLGGNALHLARCGLSTRAWDNATTAMPQDGGSDHRTRRAPERPPQ